MHTVLSIVVGMKWLKGRLIKTLHSRVETTVVILQSLFLSPDTYRFTGHTENISFRKLMMGFLTFVCVLYTFLFQRAFPVAVGSPLQQDRATQPAN